ncbi:MAG: uncharacterized protein KVP18_003274 [Porospora cf. gigantea A]|nr:MAG: hypothetical protein KVP18_003274 [Porospora cf. gigantea A]
MQHGHVVVLIGGREAVATAKKKLKAVLRSRSTYTERYIFLPVTVRSCVPNLLVFAAKISSEDEDFAVFKTVGKSMQTLYVSGEASGVKRMTVWVFTTLRQMVALDEVKCVEFAANRFLADAVATMVGDMPGIRSAEFHEGIYGQESFISIKAPCLVADSLVLWAYWCAAAMLSDEP